MKMCMCLNLANQACFNAPVVVFHTKHSGSFGFALNCVYKFIWTLEIIPHAFLCLESCLVLNHIYFKPSIFSSL